jgi:hypothetical protein
MGTSNGTNSPSTITGSNIEEWRTIEEKTISDVQYVIDRYSFHMLYVRIFHRILGTVAIVVAALAPIFVVGNSQNTTLFGIDSQTSGQIALLLTLITAIIEGLRRFYRFDRQWHSIYDARSALRRLRNDYREQRIGLLLGSPDWLVLYRSFKGNAERIIRAQAENFFEEVIGTSREASEPKHGEQ